MEKLIKLITELDYTLDVQYIYLWHGGTKNKHDCSKKMWK